MKEIIPATLELETIPFNKFIPNEDFYYGFINTIQEKGIIIGAPVENDYFSKVFNRINKSGMESSRFYSKSLHELLKDMINARYKIYEFEKISELLGWSIL